MTKKFKRDKKLNILELLYIKRLPQKINPFTAVLQKRQHFYS